MSEIERIQAEFLVSNKNQEFFWSLNEDNVKEEITLYIPKGGAEIARIRRRVMGQKFLMRLETKEQKPRNFCFDDRAACNQEWQRQDQILREKTAEIEAKIRRETEEADKKHIRDGVRITFYGPNQPKLQQGIYICETCHAEKSGLYDRAKDVGSFRDVKQKNEWIIEFNKLLLDARREDLNLEECLQKLQELRSKASASNIDASSGHLILFTCPECETILSVHVNLQVAERLLDPLSMEELQKLALPKKWQKRFGVEDTMNMPPEQFRAVIDTITEDLPR